MPHKMVIEYLLKDKEHLQQQLADLQLAHDILEYSMLNLNEERAFVVDRMKTALINQNEEHVKCVQLR